MIVNLGKFRISGELRTSVCGAEILVVVVTGKKNSPFFAGFKGNAGFGKFRTGNDTFDRPAFICVFIVVQCAENFHIDFVTFHHFLLSRGNERIAAAFIVESSSQFVGCTPDFPVRGRISRLQEDFEEVTTCAEVALIFFAPLHDVTVIHVGSQIKVDIIIHEIDFTAFEITGIDCRNAA